MVREARFAWDADRPLPQELSRRGWDCEEMEEEVDPIPPRRARPRISTCKDRNNPARKKSTR